jgi:hypothetical protein
MIYAPKVSAVQRFGCYGLGYVVMVAGSFLIWLAMSRESFDNPTKILFLATFALPVSFLSTVGGIRLIAYPPPHQWPGEFAGTVVAGTDSPEEAERVVATLKAGGIPAWADPPHERFEGMPASPVSVRIAVVVPARLGRRAAGLLAEAFGESDEQTDEGP